MFVSTISLPDVERKMVVFLKWLVFGRVNLIQYTVLRTNVVVILVDDIEVGVLTGLVFRAEKYLNMEVIFTCDEATYRKELYTNGCTDAYTKAIRRASI
jgi:hypothetical protein